MTVNSKSTLSISTSIPYSDLVFGVQIWATLLHEHDKRGADCLIPLLTNRNQQKAYRMVRFVHYLFSHFLYTEPVGWKVGKHVRKFC